MIGLFGTVATPVGFTGTQRGTTKEQRRTVRRLLKELKATGFHHGDCIGADAEVHEIALKMKLEVTIHPPINESKRAFCKGFTHTRPAKDYLVRNKDIVRETKILIATPGEFQEQPRSGTWATIREGFRRGKDVYIVYPDGSIGREL